ncbi:MAG: hypothetical protein CMJ58_18900 [Planctomycetaceae bacterium]|nr:hypothetical protein [Planctomycetaceae bacterium]
MLVFLLLLAVLAPIAWFISEFFPTLGIRITLGVLALVGVFFLGELNSAVRGMGERSYFADANEALIDAVIDTLDEGKHDEVARELKVLRRSYRPTYETHSNHAELVAEFQKAVEGVNDLPR